MDDLLRATARAEERHFWFRGFRWFVQPLIRRALEGTTRAFVLDCGCGTGANAVWLAQQGFDVVGVDFSPAAVERAQQRAKEAGVAVQFVAADILDLPDLGSLFGFFFDRGCYHVVRRIDVERFLKTLERITAPGTVGLVLTGNAKEKQEPGPPVVTEDELRGELGRLFDIVWLREIRFDQPNWQGPKPLGWSCFLRRRAN